MVRDALRRGWPAGVAATLAAIVIAVALASGAGASAERARFPSPLFVGNYETGDFSQWAQQDGPLLPSGRYFKLVRHPSIQGRYAFRSTVDAGAVVPGEAGQRAMVLLFPQNDPTASPTGAYEGAARWYRNYIYFPRKFRASPGTLWNWLIQWHNWPDGPCCPNLALAVDSRGTHPRLSLRVMGGGDAAHPVDSNNVITGQNPAAHIDTFVGDKPLRRGHWYESVIYVRWSVNPQLGYVKWYLDGRKVLSQAMSTLYWYADNNRNLPGSTPGPGQAYYMEGYYRPAVLPNGLPDTSTDSVFFDGATISEHHPRPGWRHPHR
jgi:Polysaccharide lyase